MLIDEADDAHKFLEENNQFSGTLLSESYPTQSTCNVLKAGAVSNMTLVEKFARLLVDN